MSSIEITVNGNTMSLPEGATPEVLIKKLALTSNKVAIERNGRLIPRSEFVSHTLNDQDTLEIVEAIGGG